MDPPLFFADPDLAPNVFFSSLNADPDLTAFLMRIRKQLKNLCFKLPYEAFFLVEIDKKDCSKVKYLGAASVPVGITLCGSVSRSENECGSGIITAALC